MGKLFCRVLAGVVSGAVVGTALVQVVWAAEVQRLDWRRPKKLVATGWDHPDAQRFRQHLAQMERWPFDGAVLELVGQRDDGKPCPMRALFHAEPWKPQWFASAVEQLRACRPERLKDNFILVGANPGNVDWFDDAGWQAIVEHWRIAAWVAKQAGCRGLLFDPEPYTPPYAQFQYSQQAESAKHSFDQYWAKARQRGRQVMEVLAAEYPEMTLFCYFLLSVHMHAAAHGDPRPALAGSGYGLLPAFLDGWLDAAPASMTFVDGCESAYRYNSRSEFLEAAVAIRGRCQELISPENRAKYRAQVQVGFGIYLDAYWNPPSSPWYIDGLGGSRVDRLRANVRDALEIADEYVWIYGEKFRWWPTPHSRVQAQTWPEALPGCDAALAFARDPICFARRELSRLQSAGQIANLLQNGDFGAEKLTLEGRQVVWKEGRPPVGWSAWQAEESKGVMVWDRQTETGKGESGSAGSAKLAGVANGCLLQAIPVQPGQRYAVQARCRRTGQGQVHLRIRWQTPESRWTQESHDVLAYPEDRPGAAWTELFTVVEVPEGVGKLLVLLSAQGQKSVEDAAWFDDVVVVRLP